MPGQGYAESVLFIAAALAQSIDPADPVAPDVEMQALVRVADPNHPDAIARSATHAILAGPPASGEYIPEPVGQLELGQWDAWEAAEAMDLSPWHEAGYEGQGVKLAVLDLQWFGSALEADELGVFESWDCWAQEGCTPPMDTLRPRFSYETGGHGLACAEVVRDLAPQVELHIVRVNGLTTFENAIEWAIRNEIDVLTLSMSFFNSSFYDGGGPAGRAVERAEENGVLLVTSSGNYAQGHYQATFNDVDWDGDHDFAEGGDRLPIFLRSGRPRNVALHWDDYGKCGDTNVDLYLYDQDGQLLDRAIRDQAGSGNCEPVERLSATVDEDQWTTLQIVASGDQNFRWNLITTGGQVEWAMPQGSVTDPGTHPLAFTVGAAPGVGYFSGVEGFSSQGPNQAGQPKPDLVAPDGLSTSVYGPTGFYGTSAASPSAAAAIAVVMSAHPAWTAREAATWIQGQAWRPLAPTWEPPDSAIGAGYLVLPDPQDLGGCAGIGLSPGLLVLGWLVGRRKATRVAVSRLPV